MRRPIRTLAALAAATTVLAACGDATEATGADDELRIVSLSATATEMLFAFGAGEHVIAVDQYSNYPPEAPLDEDLSGHEPNIEAIAEYEPTLVVALTPDDDLTEALAAVGIDTYFVPDPGTIEGVLDQIVEFGEFLGYGPEAIIATELMRDRIAEVVEQSTIPEGTTYYHEVDANYWSTTNHTSLGDAYAQLGLTSIAAAPEDERQWLQLSAEHIIESDPDVIFILDSEWSENPEEVAARDGWDVISAVQSGRIIAVGEDVASRHGPRIPDLLQQVVDAFSELMVTQ